MAGMTTASVRIDFVSRTRPKLFGIRFSQHRLGNEVRQTLERNRQVHAFEFHSRLSGQPDRRKIQNSRNAGLNKKVGYFLCVVSRHTNDANANVFAGYDRFQILYVVNKHAAPRSITNARQVAVKHRCHLKMARIGTAVVGQRHTQVSCSYDANAMDHVEAEDLAQVFSQLGNAVPNSANAELSKIGKVLSNLGRIQLKLLCERLRRSSSNT